MRSTINQPTDGPPFLRFLIMFTGLLAIAVGLAALAHRDEPASGPVQTLDPGRALRPTTAKHDIATSLRNPPATVEVASGMPPTTP